MRILFVAEQALAEAMLPVFEEDGFVADVADSSELAEAAVQAVEYGVVLLDQGVLNSQCNEYLLRWRRDGLRAHVLVLLPRDSSSIERAHCLDAGADAYLLRPLSVEELRAHLRVLRRRDRVVSAIRRVHDLEINTAIRTVKRAGQSIHLTPREFELLQFLAHHQGRVVSRSMIREHLYNDRGSNLSNVVDVYVRYLRNKIDKGFETPLILTRWGQGYLLRGENV
ncbi:MAG: response regulator transcription factor [Planctomycetes bacterium]|nr:response regulator transcription factor [Planctomycetota bacterium]